MSVRPERVLITIIIVAVMAYSGLAIVGQLSDANDQPTRIINTSAELDGTSFVAVPPGEGYGNNKTVRNSRGLALRFAGTNDSYLTGEAGVDIVNDSTWTVSQGAWVDPNATDENMTVLAVGDPNLVVRYEGARPQPTWAAIYNDYDSSHRVTVDATDPTNATVLQVVRNGSTLSIHRNTTQGTSAQVTVSGSVDGDLTGAQNFDGRLDETRAFLDALNASQRTHIVTNPTYPLANASTASRVMYDRGAEFPTVAVYFVGSDATASNASHAQGFAGVVLNDAGDLNLLNSDDYNWRNDGPEIAAVQGSRLDGAPVVFVVYEYAGSIAALDRAVRDAFGLLAVVPIVLIIVLAMRLLDQ